MCILDFVCARARHTAEAAAATVRVGVTTPPRRAPPRPDDGGVGGVGGVSSVGGGRFRQWSPTTARRTKPRAADLRSRVSARGKVVVVAVLGLRDAVLVVRALVLGCRRRRREEGGGSLAATVAARACVGRPPRAESLDGPSRALDDDSPGPRARTHTRVAARARHTRKARASQPRAAGDVATRRRPAASLVATAQPTAGAHAPVDGVVGAASTTGAASRVDSRGGASSPGRRRGSPRPMAPAAGAECDDIAPARRSARRARVGRDDLNARGVAAGRPRWGLR